MTRPVAIAVAGAGMIGRRHIAHIAASADAKLAAIVDPAVEAKDVAAAHGVPWFATITDLLARQKPDGILLATPNQAHLAHGLETIAAGIPTLVEKPIADTVAAAETLVAAADKARVPLLVGHHRRHNPLIARAKDIATSGQLGRIVAVHVFFWLLKPDDYFDTPWRRQPGAGPILMNLIHDVDLVRHLVGEITAVTAMTSNAVRGHPIEETAAILLRFENGALGTAAISDTVVAPWSWEFAASENPAYPQTDQNFLFIGGTHGSLAVPRLEVWRNEAKRSWFEPLTATRTNAAPVDPLARQISQFARVIRDEEAPLVSGRDGLETLRVIEAVKSSATSGREVAITR